MVFLHRRGCVSYLYRIFWELWRLLNQSPFRPVIDVFLPTCIGKVDRLFVDKRTFLVVLFHSTVYWRGWERSASCSSLIVVWRKIVSQAPVLWQLWEQKSNNLKRVLQLWIFQELMTFSGFLRIVRDQKRSYSSTFWGNNNLHCLWDETGGDILCLYMSNINEYCERGQ